MLEQIARNINQEESAKSQMEIGKVLTHPDGRTVKVKSGCYLDPTYGRVSNWWTWNEVKADGSFGQDESGHGW